MTFAIILAALVSVGVVAIIVGSVRTVKRDTSVVDHFATGDFNDLQRQLEHNRRSIEESRQREEAEAKKLELLMKEPRRIETITTAWSILEIFLLRYAAAATNRGLNMEVYRRSGNCFFYKIVQTGNPPLSVQFEEYEQPQTSYMDEDSGPNLRKYGTVIHIIGSSWYLARADGQETLLLIEATTKVTYQFDEQYPAVTTIASDEVMDYTRFQRLMNSIRWYEAVSSPTGLTRITRSSRT